MIRRTSKVLIGLLVCCFWVVPAFGQATVVVKNDQLPDNLIGYNCTTCFLLGAFNFGEEQAVVLTMPCDGNIVAIDILVAGNNGYFGQSVEQSIGLFNVNFCDGVNLQRGAPLQQPGYGDFIIFGPVLDVQPAGAAVHRWDAVDEEGLVPISVPVTAGQQVYLNFEWGLDWCNDGCNPNCQDCAPPTGTYTGPFIPHDGMGCTPCRNGVLNFYDTCALGSSGNIVMRVLVQCSSGDGACCLPNGNCAVMSDTNCIANQGEFQGVATTCAGSNCLPLIASCCTGTDCLDTTLSDCTNLYGGTWLGPGNDCDTGDPCGLNTSGACCLSDNTCTVISPLDCSNVGGIYNGDSVFCDFVDCDPPGACCTGDVCVGFPTTQSDCEVIIGGTWKGAGSDCSPGGPTPELCIPHGACCFATQGCLNNLTEADCVAITGASWLGEGATCVGDGVPDSACLIPCPSDCSPVGGDGQTTVLDLLDLLAQWGTAGLCDTDGSGTVGVVDLLNVLGAWGPCP